MTDYITLADWEYLQAESSKYPLTLDAIETLRQIIERETGREVAELFLHGGHWHAVTARGPVPVSELLKSGYVRVGRE